MRIPLWFLRMESKGDPLLERLQPAGWPRPKGYANGLRVPAGCDLVFVAGQIGWDAREQLVAAEFAPQFEQALRNCVAVVAAAGGGPADIVRLTVYCVDVEEYRAALEAVGQAWRAVMGRHFPCMALVQVAGLLEPGARVEIEATAALVPARGGER
jgi:enamine deaminase RidA (YjgF/YER057c/UK114 family)